LRSQNAISNSGRGGRRYTPWAFTARGVVAACGVLKSERADEVSVLVSDTLVELSQHPERDRAHPSQLAEHAARLDKSDVLHERHEAIDAAVLRTLEALENVLGTGRSV
jgi:hypothetical protein